MITRYNTKELLKSDLFIKEPVFEIIKKIKQNSSKNIIMTGGRGTGKSVVLESLENHCINSNEQAIYMYFSGVGVFAKSFPIDFVEHYYEIVVSFHLLSYLKRNYEISYEKYFKDIEIYLEEISKNTDSYIRNGCFRNVSLKKQLKFGEISTKILKIWRTKFDVKSLILLIDRFDWINNRDKTSQLVLQKYFNLFNKVVITVDSEINHEELEKKGYSLLEINYSKKIEVIKKIMEVQILHHNIQNKENIFPIEKITDEMYLELIEKTNGNISMMLSILERTYLLMGWNKNITLKENIEYALKEQLDKEKSLNKIRIPNKLYL